MTTAWQLSTQEWFAIQVRPRAEKFVAAALRSKGYEEFVPTCPSRRRGSVEIPLIPNYVFCRLNATVRSPIVTTPGVIRLVGAGRTPLPIDGQEIETLKRIVHASRPAEPGRGLVPGETVYVSDGPLRGICGVLVTAKESRRLVVCVTLLRRSVFVELEEKWITVPFRSEARLLNKSLL
jgi:transcription antitermination factor NusG